MFKLLLLNMVLIALIVIALIITKKKLKTEKAVNTLFTVSAVLTVISHYSSLVVHFIQEGTAIPFLRTTPNMLIPIYPCNVVMWSCLIYGCMKNKQSAAAKFLADFIFWFGMIACLVGMFANVDFLRAPGFGDYDTVKSVIVHAFMFFNVLSFGVFGKIKVDLPKNIKHIIISIIGMFLIGVYCNILFEAIVSEDMAYMVNSMFILHSPFDNLPFLKYPLISVITVAAYFGIFCICELFAYKKGNRWIARLKCKHTAEKV